MVWTYKVENVHPKNNYIVRRIGTKKTQLLQRIRLRKSTPQAQLADILFVKLIGRKMTKRLLQMMIALPNRGTQKLLYTLF